MCLYCVMLNVIWVLMKNILERNYIELVGTSLGPFYVHRDAVLFICEWKKIIVNLLILTI